MSSIAIVTGCNGGLGAELVKTFTRAGYFVLGIDRVTASTEFSENFVQLNIDLFNFVTDEHYRQEALDKIKHAMSSCSVNLDKLVLVNNAAEQIVKPIESVSWVDFERSIVINAAAPFFLSQSLLPELCRANGRIINISSVHGKLSKTNFSAYSISKGALDAVTRAFALELTESGVTTNSIAPAALDTDMLRAGFRGHPDKLERLADYHPSRKLGRPSDVADLVLMMVSQAENFLSGACLEVTGGIGVRLHDPD